MEINEVYGAARLSKWSMLFDLYIERSLDLLNMKDSANVTSLTMPSTKTHCETVFACASYNSTDFPVFITKIFTRQVIGLPEVVFENWSRKSLQFRSRSRSICSFRDFLYFLEQYACCGNELINKCAINE